MPGSGTAVSFVSQMAPDKCVDVPGASTTPGTQVQLYSCNGNANQKFTWLSTGPLKYGSLCLAVGGTGTGANLDAVVIATCTGAANQNWVATSAGQIVGINGKCLDVGGWKNANGAALDVYACTGGANQAWNESPTVSSTTVSGVVVYPTDNLQAKVNANPAGTTFLLRAGTYSAQSVVPKTGDVFRGDPGAIMDGANSAQYAFTAGCCGPSYPNNVRVHNIVIQNYNSPDHFGAVRVADNDPAAGGTSWTVDSCEIRYNARVGIRVGNQTQVLNNYIHHNGEVGLTGAGANILVAGNEIAYNNYQDKFDWTWNTGGGSKFVQTNGLVVRNNFSHNNEGPGFWTDLNNINTTYDGNRIQDNADAGIFHEISYAAVVSNNVIARNGLKTGRWLYGAGIVISASPDVEVYGNTLTGNYSGIVGIQQVRTEAAQYGPHLLNNLYVHDNNVTMLSTGWQGIGQGGMSDASSYYTTRNNRFVHNTYTLSGNTYPFQWMDGVHTAAQWKAYGEDVTGTFNP
ncbi:hypothetical protein tb265_25840 [Gemmatimonadetes bacterium T265]|nr:hypothetical protein tb265_25840 [Gemmatimonadetes bacterium T265]